MTRVLKREAQAIGRTKQGTRQRRGEGNMTTEAETGTMQPQVEECYGHRSWKRQRTESPPEPPKLSENKLPV